MATFGETSTVGGADATSGANFMLVSKFTLPEDGVVSMLSFYGHSTGAASNVRGVIYADSAGSPGAREAVSNQLNIPDLIGNAWRDLTFPAGVPLTAGDYWLGYICDSNGIRYYAHGVANNRKYRAEAYSASPSDPFGSVDGTDQFEITIYGTYATAPVNTVAPVASGTPVVGQTLSVTDGTWTGTAPITFTYQWQRDNSGGGVYGDIGGETNNTYLLAVADLGCNVRAVVTGTNGGGAVPANSNALGPVTNPPTPGSQTRMSRLVVGEERQTIVLMGR